MFNTQLIAALSAVFAFAAVASAAPASANVKARAADATPILEMCNFEQCIEFPLGALGTCNNMNGPFAGFAGELTQAVVPSGLVCTFFEKSSCITVTTTDSELLNAAFGEQDFIIQGTIAGAANSFQCDTF